MSIPFAVPREFELGLAQGTLLRFGALLKDADTGRIVGHLQETGVFQQLLPAVGMRAFPPLVALTEGSSVFANVQLHQLTGLVRALQTFQYANLGVALVGVGVSVAGVAFLARRLKHVEGSIRDLRDEVASQFRERSDHELRLRCQRVACLLDQARIAPEYSSAGAELRRLAGDLADAGSAFTADVQYSLLQDEIDDGALGSQLALMMLCDSARIECLLLADELVAARLTSEQVAANYMKWFDPLEPVMLTQRIAKSQGAAAHAGALRLSEIRRNRVDPLLHGLREATEAALTKPYLLRELIDQGIAGPEYLERLRAEQDHPLLVLRTNA